MERILGQLANSVTSANSLEGLTRPLLELLESVTGLESTYLTTIDQEHGLQHILYARNSQHMQIPEGLTVPWGDTLCKRALDEGRNCTDDVENCWGDSEAARALGIKTYMSQPVRMLDGELYGTLCAASAARVKVAEETVKVLGMFAQLISQQVERERTMERLRSDNRELTDHALSDPLTGVANRRALMRELKSCIERCRRGNGSLQLAFIDLDGFKAINDRHGHEVGDAFLAHIARKLSQGVRTSDFVARYGGDEFVVLTHDSDIDDLRTRLEHITAGEFRHETLVIDYPGASVGVTALRADDLDADSLIMRADSAMYARKRERRSARAVSA